MSKQVNKKYLHECVLKSFQQENVPGTYKIKDVHTLNNEQIPTLILHQGGNVQAGKQEKKK